MDKRARRSPAHAPACVGKQRDSQLDVFGRARREAQLDLSRFEQQDSGTSLDPLGDVADGDTQLLEARVDVREALGELALWSGQADTDPAGLRRIERDAQAAPSAKHHDMRVPLA